MNYEIYDFIDERGKNLINEWIKDLQKEERAKFYAKFDMLKKNGLTLLPETLTDSGVTGVYKLRGRGRVQIRPLLCAGPVCNSAEFTFLLGAKEIGDQWDPTNAPKKALKNKTILCYDPIKRRVLHERVS